MGKGLTEEAIQEIGERAHAIGYEALEAVYEKADGDELLAIMSFAAVLKAAAIYLIENDVEPSRLSEIIHAAQQESQEIENNALH